MNRQQYEEYVDHFNNKRYDKVTSYFAPDITVEFYDGGQLDTTPARTLHGAAEFAANYQALHAHTREVIELGDFWTDDKLLFAELWTEFHTFKDTPPDFYWKRKKGDVVVMTNWVLYSMEGEKMKHIRIAHFRNHHPKEAKYR